MYRDWVEPARATAGANGRDNRRRGQTAGHSLKRSFHRTRPKENAMMRVFATALMTAALALGAAGTAGADDYPSRPVKIIVPTPPGGPVDVIARIAANYLQTTLGKAFVVENRPGAGNTIGSKDAAEAAPDGYTLLYS